MLIIGVPLFWFFAILAGAFAFKIVTGWFDPFSRLQDESFDDICAGLDPNVFRKRCKRDFDFIDKGTAEKPAADSSFEVSFSGHVAVKDFSDIGQPDFR
jgi:hypothetical protein